MPGHGDELSDDTSSLFHIPDATQLVAHMLELVANEAAALAQGDDRDDRDDRLADLNVRTALVSWDALHHRNDALRLLALAEAHPLAPRLRLMAVIGDVAPVEEMSASAIGAPSAASAAASTATALGIELAEAWLWRHGKPDRAAEIADRLLAGELPSAWRAHLVELATLVHAAAARWPRVIELRTSGRAAEWPPDEVAATAALLLDRGGDARRALALCWTTLEHFPGRDRNALGWLRCFDIALDAAAQLADERWFELLDKRADLIDELPGGELEALATRLTVATELDTQRQVADASHLWSELADTAAARAPGALRRFAYLRATWSAAAANDPESRAIKLAAHRKLADAECAEVAATHAWRALELAALTDDPAVGELAHAVVDAVGSPPAERWLDVLDLAAPDHATSARFAARGGLALRWAAAIAERVDPERAIALWQRAAAAPDALPTTRDHLARRSRGDDEALSIAYQTWATAELDARCAAALWCARGIVDLSRGDFIEAEDALRRAAELDPGDPFCRAALAAVYRAGRRHDVLTAVLAELAGSLVSKIGRASCRERV